MRYLAIALVCTLLAGSARANTPPPSMPTPAGTHVGERRSFDLPEPPPIASMPAGDPSVTLPAPTPEPTPALPPMPPLEPGPAHLAVRVCIDLDGDNTCGAAEGIIGLPVVVFDASTGDPLATGKTNERGTFRAAVQVQDAMDLAAAAPALGLSSHVWDTRHGVVLLLSDVPIFPARLP